MKPRKIILSLLTFIAILALLAGCSHRRFGHEKFPPRMLEHIDDRVDDFDLNEEQMAKYQKIRLNLEADLTKHSIGHKDFMVTLRDKINQENPDISEINGLLKEKLKEMPGKLAAYLDYFEEFYNILDDAQKAELIEEFRSKLNRHRF